MAKKSEKPRRTPIRFSFPQRGQRKLFPADWSSAWTAMYEVGQPIRAGKICIKAGSSTSLTGDVIQNVAPRVSIVPSVFYFYATETPSSVEWNTVPVQEQTKRDELFAKRSERLTELFDWLHDIAEDTTLPSANKAVSDSKKAWALISAVMDHLIPVPSASAGPNGEILFVWNQGDHHLELEVFPDAQAEFFYRNRATRDVWGAEYQIGAPLSSDMLAKLYLFKAL